MTLEAKSNEIQARAERINRIKLSSSLFAIDFPRMARMLLALERKDTARDRVEQLGIRTFLKTWTMQNC